MRRSLLSFALAVVTALATVTVSPPAAASTGEEEIDYHEWSGITAFRTGQTDGVRATGRGLRLVRPTGVEDGVEYGTWTSPWYAPGFDATELIASWNATTPAGTWVTIEASARTDSGEHTAWYVLGRLAFGAGDIERTTVAGQRDEHAAVYVDTLAAAAGAKFRSFRLRLPPPRPASSSASPLLSPSGPIAPHVLHTNTSSASTTAAAREVQFRSYLRRSILQRLESSSATPLVRSVDAMTSNVPDRCEVPTSQPDVARGIELPVPRYAQTLHSGNYPEYGGGGQN